MPVMTYAEAIRDALSVALAQDPSVIVYGLGAADPKGVFGTTLDLHKEHGLHRVFDMPTSENAMTGVAIGLTAPNTAARGMRVPFCPPRRTP